jgi:ubiquinone biosynthesis protein UbiJ
LARALVLGAVIMVLVLTVALPVTFMITGAVLSMVLGWSLWSDGEVRAADSELVQLNR